MFFVAKAKRQLQMFFVAKAKRQLQKSPTSIVGEKSAVLSHFSAGVQHQLKKVNAFDSGRNYAEA
ncbi:hypothetical protein [Lysinibacillus xylanilyticus]|uniref:hypothetical protein n=1 Tax=Lysinibacillus xylanilyticus TaxID=582475 RepID=UPI003D05D259